MLNVTLQALNDERMESQAFFQPCQAIPVLVAHPVSGGYFLSPGPRVDITRGMKQTIFS